MHVQTSLILRKKWSETTVTIIKDAFLAVGVNIRGWRQLKRRFHGVDERRKDFVYELYQAHYSGETLERVVERSGGILDFYKKILTEMPSDEFKKNAQYKTVPLFQELVDRDNIQRAISVGCAFARVEHELAEMHPNVRWDLLDFMPNLKEVNQPFWRDNLNFVSSYPLQWLDEHPNKTYDVALFNRVLCIISNQEIRNYLRSLRPRCRYVIFGEQTKLHTFKRGINLDAIDPHESLPLRLHYIHNYRRIFEDCGFEMIHYTGMRSELTKEHGPQHYMILGAAQAV